MDFAQLTPAVSSRLAKLGLLRPFDLVLHLPLRYEDETQLVPIRDALFGAPSLVEGEVLSCDVQFRPRRQLVARVADDSGKLIVRLIHFYPSQAKQLAVGNRVRLYGEIRHGFWGDEMVHPKIKTVGENNSLSEALSPVYPTTAGMAQHQIAKLIHQALAASDLRDTLPPRNPRTAGPACVCPQR